MHYIWKRFVNVIFVRQYEQSFRGNRTSSANSTAFELSTVPYPLPIRHVFVTKRLDFWRDGRYRHGLKLNVDKTTDLEGNGVTYFKGFFPFQTDFEKKNLYLGQRMLVCVLKHIPGVFSSPANQNESIYSGLEVEVSNEFLAFNETVIRFIHSR